MLRGVLCIALLAPLPLVAQDEPSPGKLSARVVCRHDSSQTYALYIPSTYTPQRSWPMLYLLDPGARGRFAVERFAKAAEREGFLVAGSNNSRNGPMEPIKQAIEALWTDTHMRFS